MRLGGLILGLAIGSGCTHTTHLVTSTDGKSAWAAQDTVFGLAFLSFATTRYYCVADNGKPRCMEVEDITPSEENMNFRTREGRIERNHPASN